MTPRSVIAAFLFLPAVIALFQILLKQSYSSEFSYVHYSSSGPEGLLFLLLYLIGLSFVLLSPAIFRSKISSQHMVEWHVHKFRILFLAMTLSCFIFSVITGVGKIGSGSTHPASSFFNLIAPESFFLLYYLVCRGKSRSFALSVVLFGLYRLSQGWTGFIFQIFIMEAFLFLTRRRPRVRFFIAIFPIYIVGAAIYQFLYPLKMAIRGAPDGSISFLESFFNLLDRLSNVSATWVAYDYSNEIYNYFSPGLGLSEFLAFLRPVVPSAVMDKDFHNINAAVVGFFHPGALGSTSSDVGLVGFLSVLSQSGIALLFVYLAVVLVLLTLYSSVLNQLVRQRSSAGFLVFMLAFEIYYSGSLEIAFGYNYLTFFMILPFLYIFGVFRILRLA